MQFLNFCRLNPRVIKPLKITLLILVLIVDIVIIIVIIRLIIRCMVSLVDDPRLHDLCLCDLPLWSLLLLLHKCRRSCRRAPGCAAVRSRILPSRSSVVSSVLDGLCSLGIGLSAIDVLDVLIELPGRLCDTLELLACQIGLLLFTFIFCEGQGSLEGISDLSKTSSIGSVHGTRSSRRWDDLPSVPRSQAVLCQLSEVGSCKTQYVRSVNMEGSSLRFESLFQASDMVFPYLYGCFHGKLLVIKRHMNPRFECLVNCRNTVSGQEENALGHVS